MSTVFYIVSKKKEKEYNDFCNFLDEYKKEMKNKFSEYLKKVNGELINEDNLEYDIDRKIDEFGNSLKYAVDSEGIRFGQVSSNGFYFFADFTCRFVSDLDSVKKYLKDNKDSIIIDEYYEEYTIEQFEKIVLTGIC